MSEQENRAIVPVSHELAALGRRPEVKELARRIQTQGPAGMKLSGPEALTLAQYSFSLGANPLIGETWLLKSQDRVLGVMPGVRLYRRRADENDERTDNVRWMEPEVVADSDARSQLGVPLDARICVSVRLYRRSQTQAYAALAESLSKAGAPWSDIRQIAGTKPYITGVGYVTASEKSKMPDYQCALKRAEVHALKQAYHLPFGFIALGEGAESEVPDGAVLEEYIHEGEWKEVADDTRTQEEKHENAVKGAETLYGKPPDLPEPIQQALDTIIPPAGDPVPRNWPGEVVERAEKLWKDAGVMPPDTHTKHVVMLLNLTPFNVEVEDADLVLWGRFYRGNRDIGMTSKEAAREAQNQYAKSVNEHAPF